MSTPNLAATLFAGTAATLAMSAFASMAPLMGMPPMNPAATLGEQMGGSLALGWAAHLMVGDALAIGFVAVARPRLTGPDALRGALFAVAPWLMVQLVAMPMMGAGVFSGSAMLAMGSLVGHLLFGAVLGQLVHVTSQPAIAVAR